MRIGVLDDEQLLLFDHFRIKLTCDFHKGMNAA